jgi:glycosyltransferase involved in cell wall biosynthesis
MLLFSISIAWFIFILYFLYAIGKAYFYREFLVVDDSEDTIDPSDLTIIIPARNEAANIRRCLTSLLNQSIQENTYSVIVVDDNSSDNTASIVRNLQKDHPQLYLVAAGDLQKGWTGKNHACWKGVEYAKGNWYCFMDADIQAKPNLLKSALHFAKARRIDLLSLNPFQELVSFTERLLLPAVFLSIATSMNFSHVNNPNRSEAIANGQFLLFRRRVYEAIEGHASVRNEVMEDIAFARIVKKSGYRLYWMFGDDLIQTRMYRSLSQIWEGFSKNLVEILGHASLSACLLDSLKFLLLGWMPLILPVLTIYGLFTSENHFFGYGAFGLASLGTALLLIIFIMALKTLKIPFRFTFSFPLGFTFQVLLLLHSQWRHKTKTRKWKGRIYG